jgi:hypothetical protein
VPIIEPATALAVSADTCDKNWRRAERFMKSPAFFDAGRVGRRGF